MSGISFKSNYLMLSTTYLFRKMLAVGSSDKQTEDGVVIYREMQIVTRLFNAMVSSLLVQFLIFLTITQVLYGLLLLSNNEELSGKFTMQLFLFLVLTNGVVGVNLVFGFVAEVHFKSWNCMKKLKENSRKMGNPRSVKLYMKILKSLPVVHVSFGSTNFIEKLTPVVFQQFATERLIDALLLSNS